jgi:hypothetical protein
MVLCEQDEPHGCKYSPRGKDYRVVLGCCANGIAYVIGSYVHEANSKR